MGHLKYCHGSISEIFTHGQHRGQSVLTLLGELRSGSINAKELPPMLVMRSACGAEVVCGNRRLYCLKQFAAETATPVRAWCIVYNLMAQNTPRELLAKYMLARTTLSGNRITLRRRGRQAAHGDL